MRKKAASLIISLLLILTFFVVVDMHFDVVPIAKGDTIYVGGVNPGNYSTIQEGIDAANPGDTVYVYNGTYNENLVVAKTINLTGEGRDTTIIYGIDIGDVVYVTADWMNITGFTITNGSYGINLDSSSNSNIVGNTILWGFWGGIRLLSSLNNNISDNIVHSNNGDGIYLYLSSNNNISNNNISHNENGIHLRYSSNNSMSGNNVYSNNNIGIYLSESPFNTIINNSILNNSDGLYLSSSSNNSIINLNISKNALDGLRVSFSSNNNIRGNNVTSNNRYGIYITNSLNSNMTNNNLFDDGIVIAGKIPYRNSHTIPGNNKVNDKPVYYIKDCSSISIDSVTLGQLILANCTNVSVTNLKISNTDIGIDVGYSTDISLRNNTISSNNHFGICLASSSNNAILYNNISNNGDNVSLPIGMGILISYSSSNNIKNNTISSNGFYGIVVYYSLNNEILNNTISSNYGRGIQVGLSSNNNNITNNHISSNSWGVYLSSSNNNITNNNVFSNTYGGVSFWSSLYNNFTKNNVCSNGNYGIKLNSSANNRIYHNNIIDNTYQAFDDSNDNYWDSGYPGGGNYWSDFDEPGEGAYDDYKGPDQNVLGRDNIVDNGTIGGGGKNPYIIDSDSQDNYPLMGHMANLTFLYLGWNLISIPRSQPRKELEDVLSQINGFYDIIQLYNASDSKDPWKLYSSSKPPHMNDLDSIDHTIGLWIHITEPGGVILNHSGIIPTKNQIIDLHKGWNMVGYPSLTSKYRDEALNNLDYGIHVDSVWTYNSGTQKWEEVGELNYFVVGKGYWIHAKENCVWEVPL